MNDQQIFYMIAKMSQNNKNRLTNIIKRLNFKQTTYAQLDILEGEIINVRVCEHFRKDDET